MPSYYVMPHGMLDPWFQTAASRRVKAWRNWAYWKLIERHTIEAADGVLFTSQRELELARRPFTPYRPKQAFNVGYGVANPPADAKHLSDAYHAACPTLGNRTYLLFLSRIHSKKGVDLLIDAYADVVQRRTQRQLESPALVIAGPLDSAYSEKMQSLAKERKKMDRTLQIVFPGMLTGDAKWGAFYGCQAFVLASHQENFGIAVVEALACRKPVLISDQVNISDEIKAAGAGFVCSTNKASIVESLAILLDQSAESLARMSAAARECYDCLYRPEAAAERLLAVIDPNITAGALR